MSDLVERLRDAVRLDSDGCNEAADEIERLKEIIGEYSLAVPRLTAERDALAKRIAEGE